MIRTMMMALAVASILTLEPSKLASQPASPAVGAMVWSPQAADQLVRALDRAKAQGIDAQALIARARSAAGQDDVLTEVARTYARDLAHGLVDPEDLHDIFGLKTNTVDIDAGLREALRQGRISQWLDSLAPQDPEYRALSAAYAAYADRPAIKDIPAGPAIRPGSSDPRTPAILSALARLGYATPAPPVAKYDRSAAASVRAFQADFGLATDGIVGPDTLTMLNKGPGDRARLLAVNLERRRWLTRAPPANRIDVNLAAGELVYWREGRPAWRTRIVAGASRSQTPLIEETFDRLVVNPPWNVPQSIAQREILPKGAGYLAAHNMYVSNGRVIQRPGPSSSLGQVKFDMQNRYAIYLHDTPSKALFSRKQRFFSHGCVRVENAVDFARRLASESGEEEAFDAALSSGSTRVVRLDRSLTVRLLYETVFVDEAGKVQFRPDEYGLDDTLSEALGLGPGIRAAKATVPADLGP